MNFLSDVLTYIRRIIKAPSNSQITDDLLIDYVNRFWIMDVDARLQLFDLKTTYRFQTTPGVDKYNMPLYDVQTEPGSQTIGMYPVYQGFTDSIRINGLEAPFYTQRQNFYSVFPNIIQYSSAVAVGDGTRGPYNLVLPILPNNSNPINTPVSALLRAHIDISGIIASGSNNDPIVVDSPTASTSIPNIPVTSVESQVYITTINANGANMIVCDSGQLLQGNQNYGLLMQPGNAPKGNTALSGGYSTTLNTVNYLTGEINVEFPTVVPSGNNINVQVFYFQTGVPRGALYYNNTIVLRQPPSQSYLVELDAYLTPAAFLSSSAAVPFAYMAEYIARGAARKILADTGDVEQFQFYEPLFLEQEALVWKRSQRQFTATRTETIYSQGKSNGYGGYNYGGTSNG